MTTLSSHKDIKVAEQNLQPYLNKYLIHTLMLAEIVCLHSCWIEMNDFICNQHTRPLNRNKLMVSDKFLEIV